MRPIYIQPQKSQCFVSPKKTSDILDRCIRIPIREQLACKDR